MQNSIAKSEAETPLLERLQLVLNEDPWRLGVDSTNSSESAEESSTDKVRQNLRLEILSGKLAPGTFVDSVTVAERFGVSRTPVREALRALIEEGYLVGQKSKRVEVVRPSVDELEAVFAERMFLMVISTRLTVPKLTQAELDRMQALLNLMAELRAAGEHAHWRHADNAFHSTHVKHVSESVRNDHSRLFERSSMFRAIWLRNRNNTLTFSIDDHPLILEACIERDANRAALLAARHLMRVAVTLCAEIAPGRDLNALREVLRMAGENDY
jgi:DNA-binding GntR family transcriptional regulator